MIVLDILQWVGAILILVGYWFFSFKSRWAPITTVAGSIVMGFWGVATGNWGVVVLNLVICAVNIFTIIKWVREQ